MSDGYFDTGLTKVVSQLHGIWPTYYGILRGFNCMEVDQIIAVHMRYGILSIGVGKDEDDAYKNLEQIDKSDSWEGVTGPGDAIFALERRGYIVTSVGGGKILAGRINPQPGGCAK
jgi:hypothetical protein